jgi:hypothetical protein
MFCTTPKYNSYNRGYGMMLNPIRSDRSRGMSNKIVPELDVSSEGLYEMRKAARTDIDAYPSSILSISEEGWTGSDDNTSSCESIFWESLRDSEFQDNSNHNHSDYNNSGRSLARNSMVHEQLLSPLKNSKSSLAKLRLCDDYSTIEFPNELVLGNYRNSMWGPPISPICQLSQSPNYRFFPDYRRVFTNPYMTYKAVTAQDVEQRSRDCQDQVNSTLDELQDECFLLAFFDDAEELRIMLSWRGLEVQKISRTRIPGALGVLFRTRKLAKQAFIQQKEIGVRFVPYDTTSKYWHKRPSPKFHVIFETTRRLTVKSGKSFSNKTIGDFLMKNSRMDRGCLIWADQMMGYRLRVVGFVGKLMRKDGRVIVRDEPPYASERKVIGWVSTQCNITKTKFVLRLTGKQIKNYLCSGPLKILE